MPIGERALSHSRLSGSSSLDKAVYHTEQCIRLREYQTAENPNATNRLMLATECEFANRAKLRRQFLEELERLGKEVSVSPLDPQDCEESLEKLRALASGARLLKQEQLGSQTEAPSAKRKASRMNEREHSPSSDSSDADFFRHLQ